MTKEKRMEQIVGGIANEITWLKGKVEVIEYSKGYIDGRLANNTFFIIAIEDEHGARISVNKYGLYRVLIPVDKINDFLRQLCK